MILIYFLITINQIFSQDLEPAPMPLLYNSEQINIDQDRFKQNEFILGWQWGGHKKMINAMGTNVKVGGGFGKYFEWESYETNNLILAQPGKKATGSQYPFIQAAAWLQFEPALKIPDNGKFVTISDDPSNPVFGFKYISEYGTVTYTNDYEYFFNSINI